MKALRSKLPASALLWAAIFCAGLVLYLPTLQRGLEWQDSGTFQWRILHGDYVGTVGLASAHPTYIAAARLFLKLPIADPITQINMFSAVAMAVALANVAWLATRLTGARALGVAAAAMLAVMHTPWWLATTAEGYTLHLALMTVELLLLVELIRTPRWYWAAALFLANGVSLGVHNMALLALPAYAVCLAVLIGRRRLPVWCAVAASAAFAAGAAPLLLLTVQEALVLGGPAAAVRSMLFGQFSSAVRGSAHGGRYFKVNAVLVGLNFLSAVLPLAAAGWLAMRRRLGALLAGALLGITAVQGLFVIRYSVPDQFMFFLPTLTMLVLAASLGAADLAERSGRWRRRTAVLCVASVLLPPLLYAAVPGAAAMAGAEVKRQNARPFRSEIRYWAIPWKHNEGSAERFGAAALHQVPPGSVIISDRTALYPLVITRDTMPDKRSVAVLLAGAEQKELCRLEPLLAQGRVFVTLPNLSFCLPEIAGRLHYTRSPGEVLYRVALNNK